MTTSPSNRLEELKPHKLNDDQVWQVGYYLLEFLRLGNRYHDLDMLLSCLPLKLQQRAKELIKNDD